MHIVFTEKEMEYIQKTGFKWSVKADCPNDIKKNIARKMSKLGKQTDLRYYIENGA